MYKITVFLLLVAFSLNAQTKKGNVKNKKDAVKDSILPAKVDTVDPIEEEIKAQRKFGVYTRKARKPDNRMKLCINLVSPASVLNLCINDSICKFPEASKILFEKTNNDSTYVLVFVEAFTKAIDKPSCDAGRETKLFYIRWNTKTNKAIWKQRTVSSCIKVVTNMTREPITNWDGVSTLIVNYYRGGKNFVELRFDPNNYLLGFQSPNDTGQGN
jgi:hypothetical protein